MEKEKKEICLRFQTVVGDMFAVIITYSPFVIQNILIIGDSPPLLLIIVVDMSLTHFYSFRPEINIL